MGIYSNRDVIITGSIVNIDATVKISEDRSDTKYDLSSYGVLSPNGNAVINSSTAIITATVDSAAQNTDSLNCKGIAATENITINNNSNVTVTTNVRADNQVTRFSESNGISGSGKVSIGSTGNDKTVVTVNINSNVSLESLNVDPDTGHDSIGILGRKGISITNAQVGITISANDGTPAGMYSSSAENDISINSGEVTIKVSSKNGGSTGISSWGSVNVSNSENLTVTATTQKGESVGIETYSFDNVNISICDSNATVTVEGTISRGIYSPTINIGENGDDTSIVDIMASHLEGENSSAVEVKGEEIHVDDNLVLVRGKEHTLDYSEHDPGYSEKVITDASEATIN